MDHGSSSKNIACVGAGPAGLYFAILLKQFLPDWRVTVFERQAEQSTIGWGVVIYLDALERSDAPTALEIRARSFTWPDTIVHVQGKAPVVVDTPGNSIGRRALIDIFLARARALDIEIRFEHEISDPAQLAGFDLIVAADGVNSGLRDARRDAFGTKLVRSSNRYIWLGTSRVFQSFTFPFVQTEAGWIWAHAYGFDQARSTFIVELSPQTWSRLGFDRMSVEETIQRLQELFAEWLDGHPLWPPAGTRGTAPWLEFQTVTNSKWHADRVALMGDAAHTTHFTIGSGTRLAIEDAISLASQLRDHREIEPALSGYEARRIAELQVMQREATNSATWFESLPRYIDRNVNAFTELLYSRRSTVVHYLPPSLYLGLHHASTRHPIVGHARRAWHAIKRRLSSMSA